MYVSKISDCKTYMGVRDSRALFYRFELSNKVSDILITVVSLHLNNFPVRCMARVMFWCLLDVSCFLYASHIRCALS